MENAASLCNLSTLDPNAISCGAQTDVLHNQITFVMRLGNL